MPAAENAQGGARVRIPPPLVFLVSIVLGVVLHYGVSRLYVPFGRALQLVTSVLLVVGGLSLAGSAFGLFKRSGQDPKPWKPSPSLLLQGPYRFTRNPIYVGMTMLQVAVGLALDDLWVVLLAAPSLLVVHFTAVLPEEAYLEERFGDPYRQFKATVRRYL
jgi:protein-S-isoprenylcysteine O-methyltransferase Ste14